MAAAPPASIVATTSTTDPTGRPSSGPGLHDLPPSASPQAAIVLNSSSGGSANIANFAGASTTGHNNSTSTNINTKNNTNINNNSGNSNRNGIGNTKGRGSNNVVTIPDPVVDNVSPSPDMRLYPRDGRVRNPVPSKLKGVTEEMRGNFSVMHMDVTSHRESQDRDAAAKLTSESTARQAQLAQTDSYISHHRRANYPRPAGLKQFASPSSSKKPHASPAPQTTASKRPLTVAETKAEQARLLTLLRTLPPPTIVDQICKALAFFGGIPEAPPPADGKFPESAEANGSGSLFVGWIAEIFPDLDNPRQSTLLDSAPLQKRPRGRPKGSKASKVRSDKGVKKGTQKRVDSAVSAVAGQEPQDDSWVDIEDSVLELNGEGDLVEVSAAPRNALSTPSRGLDREIVDTTPATGSTVGFRSINNDQAASTNAGAKRRGRPKGSKNRPKDADTSQSTNQAAAAPTVANTVSHSVASTTPAPPKVTPVPVPTPTLDSQPKKANTGRPKGSKNRLKHGTGGVTVQPSTEPRQQSSAMVDSSYAPFRAPGSSSLVNTVSSTLNGVPSQGDSGTQLPTQLSLTSGVGTTTPLVKESTIVGIKRKRQAAKAGDTAGTEKEKDTSNTTPTGRSMVSDPTSGHHSTVTQSPAVSQVQPQSINQQAVSVDTSTPVAKRIRKAKESSSAQAGKRQTPINPPPTKDTAPTSVEPTRQASTDYERMSVVQGRTDQGQGYTTNRPQRQSQPPSSLPIGKGVSQTPAEGLEAHYERFAALQTHRHDSTSRSQKPSQTVSPTPLQASKSSQLPVSLASQSQTRTSQNYYPQPQPLGATYNATTQAGFAPSQRQQQQQQQSQQQMHVNSPQYGTQSNSPLLQGDTSYRASPTAHSSAAFVPRRTPSASPLDANNYRSNGATSQSLSSQASHFGPRHSAVTTTHGASHPGLQSSFQAFSTDPSFLDIQSLDSSNSHGGMGLGTGPYGLGSGTATHHQQQRTSNATAAPAYSQASGLSNYLGSSGVGRTSQNRWPS